MKAFINISIIIMTFTICSCQEPIDINVPDTEKKIVLNGLINPDSIIRINLSKSIGIIKRDEQVEFLTNAKVNLYENDVFKEVLHYDTFGYYIGTIRPKIGKSYTITAKYTPLQTVDAETNILNSSGINSVSSTPEFISTTETWYDSETGEPFDTTIVELLNLRVDINFQDPANQDNYYLLNFSAFIPQYVYSPPNYEPIYTGDKMTSLYFDAQNLNWENYYETNDLSGYVFSDNLFNGTNYSVNANISYFGDNPTGRGSSPDKIYVNLHSITENFYNYVISYSKYQNILGNPLAEPVNIMTNVTNGFGFFSGYSTTKDSVIIDYSQAK